MQIKTIKCQNYSIRVRSTANFSQIINTALFVPPFLPSKNKTPKLVQKSLRLFSLAIFGYKQDNQ
jgi:hypothetical protein